MKKCKKTVSLALSLLMVLSCFSGLSLLSAAKTDASGFQYEVVNGGAVITGCTETVSGDVVIPGMLGGVPVTSIGLLETDDVTFGYDVFEETTLSSLTIPASVEAFNTSVLPVSDTFVGVYVDPDNAYFSSDDGILYDKEQTELLFYPAGRTDSVCHVDASVTSIWPEAFSGCRNLKAFDVDADNECYASEDGVLFDKVMDTLVYYPLGKSDAVYTVPDDVSWILYGAFEGNKYLKRIVLPESISGIGGGAFWCCANLSEIVFPADTSSLRYLASSAFFGTAWYESQPDGFIYIDTLLLGYKGEMPAGTHVKIADGTTLIADGVLGYNDGIVSISIPESVRCFSDSWGPFDGDENLETVYYAGSEAAFSLLVEGELPEGVSFVYAKENTLEDYLTYEIANGGAVITDCSPVASGDFVIPDTLGGYPVTGIGSFPDSSHSYYDVFIDCDNITSITIPKSVEYLNWEAFPLSQNFSAINVAEENQTFTSENGVLYSKDRTELICYPIGKPDASFTMPASVGYCATDFSYCDSLSAIEVEDGNECYSSEDGVLFDSEKMILVCYPAGKTDASYTVPDGISDIDFFAFSGNPYLKKLTLPESVRYIYDYAFAGCENLSSLFLLVDTAKMEYIGDGILVGTAFYESQPDGLVYLDTVLLGYKGEMPDGTSVVIREGTTFVCDQFLQFNSSVVSISIPASVRRLAAWNPFSYDENLESVTFGGSEAAFSLIYDGVLPEDVTFSFLRENQLEDYFRYEKTEDGVFLLACSRIIDGHFVIPDTIDGLPVVGIGYPDEEIWGGGVFENCNNLTAITIPASVTSITDGLIGFYLDEDYNYVPINGFAIYGTPGTAAETYAQDNGILFVSVTEDPAEKPTEDPAEKPTEDPTEKPSGTDPVLPGSEDELIVKDENGLAVSQEEKIVSVNAVNNLGLTSSELKARFDNETVVICNADGDILTDSECVGTGCRIQVMNRDGEVCADYIVCVPMDVDGDAAVTAQDARLALRAAAHLEILSDIALLAANVDENEEFSAADARKILRKAANLE